jgi:hypothetical protein
MSQAIAGTFACGASAGGGGQTSPQLVIPSSTTIAKLTLSGAIDANNTCKTQRSTDNGATWVDQTTYNSAQANVPITVAHGEHWRLVSIVMQAIREIRFKLSVEN